MYSKHDATKYTAITPPSNVTTKKPQQLHQNSPLPLLCETYGLLVTTKKPQLHQNLPLLVLCVTYGLHVIKMC